MAQALGEDKYFICNRDKTILYTIQKRPVTFKDQEASLIFIRDSTALEKAHVKATEKKYKHLLLNTVTHDLKTPIMQISGQYAALSDCIKPEGEKNFIAAKVAFKAFEYYIYDLIVFYYVMHFYQNHE